MGQPARADLWIRRKDGGITHGSVPIHTNPREEVWISVKEAQEEALKLVRASGIKDIEKIEVDIPLPIAPE